MLTTEKYLSLFIERFNERSSTPLNYKSDILNHALQFREDNMPPHQAADWSFRFIDDKETFLATPAGRQFQEQILSTQKRLHENLDVINTWQQHELLMLIRMHVNITRVSTGWLLKFRDDLDLMV